MAAAATRTRCDGVPGCPGCPGCIPPRLTLGEDIGIALDASKHGIPCPPRGRGFACRKFAFGGILTCRIGERLFAVHRLGGVAAAATRTRCDGVPGCVPPHLTLGEDIGIALDASKHGIPCPPRGRGFACSKFAFGGILTRRIEERLFAVHRLGGVAAAATEPGATASRVARVVFLRTLL